MRCGGNLGHFAKQLDIRGAVVKEVVPHQAAIGFAAWLIVFLPIYLLEKRALIPERALVFLERFAKLVLANVDHADLQHGVCFRIAYQVMQPSPSAFELLKIRMMENEVHLSG